MSTQECRRDWDLRDVREKRTNNDTNSKMASLFLSAPFYLLNQLNASSQVHAEIDEGPVDTLPLILFLFENEHVVVEELLQLLIREIDTQLLEAIKLKGSGSDWIERMEDMDCFLEQEDFRK